MIQLCCPPKDLVIEVNRVISKEHDKNMTNNFGLSKAKPYLSGHNMIYRIKDCSGVRNGDTCGCAAGKLGDLGRLPYSSSSRLGKWH